MWTLSFAPPSLPTTRCFPRLRDAVIQRVYKTNFNVPTIFPQVKKKIKKSLDKPEDRKVYSLAASI